MSNDEPIDLSSGKSFPEIEGEISEEPTPPTGKEEKPPQKSGWLFWRWFVAFFTALGRFQLALTAPRWMRSFAAWLYILWFIALALVPGWAGISPAIQLGWAGLVFLLGLGLIVVYFRHDGEKEAARRGLLIGEGEFVNAIVTGLETDPQLRLESRYPKRLGFVTLMAAGLGLTLAFALLCEGIFHSGFHHWYKIEGSEIPIEEMDPPLGQWALYASLSVFRALDLFDTLPTFRYDPPLVRHEGWDVSWIAPGLCFAFKFMFDLFLLAKLRSLLGARALFRQVVKGTGETPPEDRDKVRRSLSGTLLSTGDFFVTKYANLFLDGMGGHSAEVNKFARETLKGAGVQARIHVGKTLISELEKASGKGRDPNPRNIGRTGPAGG